MLAAHSVAERREGLNYMSNEAQTPSEADQQKVREIIEAELGKRGTTGLEAQIGRSLDRLELSLATALTEARAETWKVAITTATQFLQMETATMDYGGTHYDAVIASIRKQNQLVNQIVGELEAAAGDQRAWPG